MCRRAKLARDSLLSRHCPTNRSIRAVTHGHVERLAAPEKALVVVPRTGHAPNAPMLDAIHTLLVERARALID